MKADGVTGLPGVDIDMLIEYEDFVIERHRVWEARRRGDPQPWTDHWAVQRHKFTNVFRALDYGSQYLLTDVFTPGLSPRNTLLRCLLYRHTGSVPAWEYLDVSGVGLPTVDNLEKVRDAWKRYRSRTGCTPFTNAYAIYPQSLTPGTDKIDAVIDLAQRLMYPSSADDIATGFIRAWTQSADAAFQVLRSQRGLGDFMAMQILTDWGYSPHGGDRENEMIVAGPGARRGAKALMPGEEANRAIMLVKNWWLEHPGCPRLPGGRPVSLMDVQNTLCEFSKLLRYEGKPLRDAAYQPAHPGGLPEPVFPTHWSGVKGTK